jgi:histidinol-phosphate aminotransferase
MTQSSNDEEALIDALCRQNVRDLAPYRCARDDYDTGILLDANENTHGPAITPTPVIFSPVPSEPMGLNLNVQDWTQVESWHDLHLHRYPDPYHRTIQRQIASGLPAGCTDQNVLVTSGSDELLDLLVRAYCRPDIDAVLVCPPTVRF